MLATDLAAMVTAVVARILGRALVSMALCRLSIGGRCDWPSSNGCPSSCRQIIAQHWPTDRPTDGNTDATMAH